jgi:hypothetical protein
MKKIYWGVFFIALSTLAWEILLTRIFSATMYYHFVFVSISLAMLGFGCSGVIVFLFPRYFSQDRCSSHLAIFSSLFSITIVLAIGVYLQVNTAVTTASLSTFLVLLKIFFFIFLPYLFSGLTITLALKHYSKKVAVLYCYDLVGAGIGCIFVIGMLFIYDGISLVLLTSFLAAVSSIFFSRNSSATWLRKISFSAAFLLLCAFLCNAYVYRFLKINYVQGKPQTNIILEKWNPINRITVETGREFNNDFLIINYDSAASAKIHAFDGDTKKVNFLNDSITSFYYQIRKNSDVLIIGVGGGQDVLNARINGQRKITGVEINPTIARLNTDTYRNFNGNLFAKPGIQLVVDDGRNFIRHATENYDIIHLSNVDSGVASSSGAFTFVENSLYTAEAFKDYYNHLKNDGVLWITRWRYTNDAESFRILSGNLMALKELGVQQPENHIVMLAEKYRPSWCQALFLLKRTPFTHEEIIKINALREKMGLEWLLNPEQRVPNQLSDYLFSPDKKAFLRHYIFRVDPNTDNCPFFFNFLKPIHYIWKLPGKAESFTYPVFMFKSLFIITFFMVLVTMFLPLVVFKKVISLSNDTVSYRIGYLGYFICLGLGFMLVEIPLIQKFILFLGQPLYAISVILSSLLIFSGIGSLLAGTFPDAVVHPWLRRIILSLCLLLSIYTLFLPALFESMLGIPGLLRIFASILLICPLGLSMGMAFPLGIKLLERDGRSMIPWVWGVNGACSVMGSIIAWGFSLNFGYNFTLYTATAVYGCALLIMVLKPSASHQ